MSPALHPLTPDPSRRRFLLGSLAAIAVAGSGGLLAACGSDAPASGPARRGGRLRVAVAGRSASSDVLDPHVAGSSACGALAKNVWDKLVAYDDDLTLRYRLATALEPSADAMTWRIVLRDDVVFSDGTPFTSRDVLWSLQRMLDPAKPSSGDLSAVDLDRTVADGDHAVVVALTEPIADFGSVLAGWYVYMIQDGTTTFDRATLPVGTGPFTLADWSPGDRTLLRRNDRYWDGDVLLDEVELIQLAESEARMNAFASGEVDVVHELTALQARAARERSDMTLQTPPFGIMSGLQMRVDTAPFDDVRVRQAMRLSIDREAIVRTVHLGYAEVGNDLYGKGAPFYADTIPQRTYDPAEAKRLLRDAGRSDLTVTLHVSEGASNMVEIGSLYKEHAKAAGITINLKTHPADTYHSQVAGQESFTHVGWWNYSLDYFYGQTMTSDAPTTDRPGDDRHGTQLSRKHGARSTRPVAPSCTPSFSRSCGTRVGTSCTASSRLPRDTGRPSTVYPPACRGPTAGPAIGPPGSRHESRPVTRYAIRRLGGTAMTLLVVAGITFALFELLPGDAATTALSRHGAGGEPSSAQLAALRQEMGLDRPAPVRFGDWLLGLLRGDLGDSLISGRPVGDVIGSRGMNSLVLALATIVLLVPISVGLGLWAGSRPGSTIDRVVSGTVLAAEALPGFVLGVFLIAVVALSWGLLPAVSLVPTGTSPWSRPEVLVLPVVCLLAGMAPHPVRVVRAQTVEVMSSDYVHVARLHGIAGRRLLLRHVAPNAVPAAVHPLVGSLVGLVGGIAIVEILFGYPGLAEELLRAISSRDFPFVQSAAVLLAAFGLAVYLAGDLIALWLSPLARRAAGVV